MSDNDNPPVPPADPAAPPALPGEITYYQTADDAHPVLEHAPADAPTPPATLDAQFAADLVPGALPAVDAAFSGVDPLQQQVEHELKVEASNAPADETSELPTEPPPPTEPAEPAPPTNEQPAVTDEERAHHLALNEDHHRRMAADYHLHQASGALPGFIQNDELSREHLVQAMLNCERRCEMRDDEQETNSEVFGNVVLELGAGSGRDQFYLEEKLRARYCAIDVVDEFFQGDFDSFKRVSVEEMPDHWEGRFRYIYSRHVMEHVLNPDRAIQRLKKVLAPNGIIGAVTPHLFPDNEPAHVTKLRVEEWFAAYERNGLRVVYCPVLQFNCPETVLVAIHQEWQWPPTKD